MQGNIIKDGKVSPQALGDAIKNLQPPRRVGQQTYPLRASYRFGAPYTSRKKRRK